MKTIRIILLFALTPALNLWAAWFDDQYRPQFHFSRDVRIGDPCGMVRWKGVWTIFTWDRATSSDLVYWNLSGWPFRNSVPNTSYFTGSAVVDFSNSSGFGTITNPPMILAVTLHNDQTLEENIGIASSTDYANFYFYSGNPVVDGASQIFRDADVFWDDEHNFWVMLVAHNSQITIMTSTDLKFWAFKSDFGPVDGGWQNFEVPGMARMPVKGVIGKKKWVLFSGPGSRNCQYWVGNFDGTFFTPEGGAQFIESGPGRAPQVDFYAAKLFRDYDGGDCLYWWAWMDNWDYANNLPTSFGSGYTLVRKLQLAWTGSGYRLAQEPHEGYQKLRGPLVPGIPRKLQGTVSLSEFQPATNTYEIVANFKLTPQTQKFGFNLCVGNGNKVVLGYDVGAGNIFLDRTNSGNTGFSGGFPNVRTAAFLPPNGQIQFHIFVDQNSIEVFINDGQIVFTDLIFPASTSRGIELWSDNGVVQLQSLNAWMLKSIWH